MTCFGAILIVSVGPLGVKNTDAGWIGFWHIICGLFSGLIRFRSSDPFNAKKKVFLIVLYILATVSSMWFTLLYSDIIASFILPGGFAYATIPLCHEVSCEVSYPVTEGDGHR